ncbi:hypothetical protein MMC06_004901 [Schaereria dolodes]|nr:hypothetical protein [Schaereria dolodes]
MHKRLVKSALSKSGSVTNDSFLTDSIALSLRQFHVSLLRAENEAQTSILKNLTRDNQDTTQKLENRYTRAGNDRQFQFTIRRIVHSAPKAQIAGAIDARSLAADSSTIAGQLIRPAYHSQGASGSGVSYRGAIRGNTDAIQGNRGSFQGDRGSFRGDRGAFRDSMGSFQANRNAVRGNIGTIGGIRGGFRGRGNRGEAGESRSRYRGNEGKGQNRKKSELPRVTVGEDGEWMINEPEPEEMIYLSELSEKKKAKKIEYEPCEVSFEALTGSGPALAVGQWGMREVFEERLNRLSPASSEDDGIRRHEMAKELSRGGFVRFRDDEEKNDIIALAQATAERGAKLSEAKGEIVKTTNTDFEPLDENERAQMVADMLKGDYQLTNHGAKEGVLQGLLRNIGRNETYYPKDSNSLAAKVKSMLLDQTRQSRNTNTAGA